MFNTTVKLQITRFLSYHILSMLSGITVDSHYNSSPVGGRIAISYQRVLFEHPSECLPEKVYVGSLHTWNVSVTGMK